MQKKDSRKQAFTKKEPKEFEEEVVEIARVTRVVKGGRKLRFRATVVIGNKKGKIGMGIGKSHEVTGAIQKAIAKAKKNLITIKIDGLTIPHQVKVKYKAAKILLLPAGPGTGLIAGGTIRKVLDLAGIKNILSKSFGTTNKISSTKATFVALQNLKATPRMIKNEAKKAEQSALAKEKESGAQKPKPKLQKSTQKPALKSNPETDKTDKTDGAGKTDKSEKQEKQLEQPKSNKE